MNLSEELLDMIRSLADVVLGLLKLLNLDNLAHNLEGYLEEINNKFSEAE